MNEPVKKKAVIYHRTASSLQSEQSEVTLSKLKDVFTKKGYSITRVYIDEGFSGNSIERPSFSQMLDDLKANKDNEIVSVIVSDLSRLARNEQILLTMRDKIIEAGGCIASPDQNLHLNMMEASLSFWNNLQWYEKLKFWIFGRLKDNNQKNWLTMLTKNN